MVDVGGIFFRLCKVWNSCILSIKKGEQRGKI